MKKSDLQQKAQDIGNAAGELGKKIVEVAKDAPGEVLVIALVDVLAFATRNADEKTEEQIMAQYLASRRQHAEEDKKAKG